MQCSVCHRKFDFVKLEDGTFMCASCTSNSHIEDQQGRCWCNPELQVFGENRVWIHNRFD